MYMYYFLGFKLSCDPDLTEEQKIVRSRSTYLLALDGDVDFQPIALILLIDLMRRQEKVGAVCGRIHPIGSGTICITSCHYLNCKFLNVRRLIKFIVMIMLNSILKNLL